MKVVRIPVDIEEQAFWRLAALAELHDMKVPDFLAELAIVESAQPAKAADDRVLTRWREGLTDSQIGAALNMTNAAVATRRRALKLPANKRTN